MFWYGKSTSDHSPFFTFSLDIFLHNRWKETLIDSLSYLLCPHFYHHGCSVCLVGQCIVPNQLLSNDKICTLLETYQSSDKRFIIHRFGAPLSSVLIYALDLQMYLGEHHNLNIPTSWGEIASRGVIPSTVSYSLASTCPLHNF